MKKIFIILTCIIIIFTVLPTLFYSATNVIYRNPSDWFKCLKDGGDYIEDINYLAPKKGLFYGDGYICKYTYIDGGKECFSNEDCTGICLVTEDTIIEDRQTSKSGVIIPKVIGGSGKCSSTNYFPNGRPGDFDVPIKVYY
jgi:hypothetical protein